MNPKVSFGFLLLLLPCYSIESKYSKGCDLALTSYYVWQGANFSFIVEVMQSNILKSTDFDTILLYNSQVSSKDNLQSFIRINIHFLNDCINDEFLGHFFTYNIRTRDTYGKVVNTYYANLTTILSLMHLNTYPKVNILDNGVLNVTVNYSVAWFLRTTACEARLKCYWVWLRRQTQYPWVWWARKLGLAAELDPIFLGLAVEQIQ